MIASSGSWASSAYGHIALGLLFCFFFPFFQPSHAFKVNTSVPDVIENFPYPDKQFLTLQHPHPTQNHDFRNPIRIGSGAGLCGLPGAVFLVSRYQAHRYQDCGWSDSFRPAKGHCRVCAGRKKSAHPPASLLSFATSRYSSLFFSCSADIFTIAFWGQSNAETLQPVGSKCDLHRSSHGGHRLPKVHCAVLRSSSAF